MNDPRASCPTPRRYAVALEDAASEEACLAEDLALLAAMLEGYGCLCAADAFRRAARRHRVQSLLQNAQALAVRVV